MLDQTKFDKGDEDELRMGAPEIVTYGTMNRNERDEISITTKRRSQARWFSRMHQISSK